MPNDWKTHFNALVPDVGWGAASRWSLEGVEAVIDKSLDFAHFLKLDRWCVEHHKPIIYGLTYTKSHLLYKEESSNFPTWSEIWQYQTSIFPQ
jgi:hypothetical protein